MISLANLLAPKRIVLNNITPGNHKTQFPTCQASRVKNKSDMPVSVKGARDLKSALWNCHHCGWNGSTTGWDSNKRKENGKPDTSETPGSWDKPRNSGNVIRADFRKRRF